MLQSAIWLFCCTSSVSAHFWAHLPLYGVPPRRFRRTILCTSGFVAEWLCFGREVGSKSISTSETIETLAPLSETPESFDTYARTCLLAATGSSVTPFSGVSPLGLFVITGVASNCSSNTWPAISEPPSDETTVSTPSEASNTTPNILASRVPRKLLVALIRFETCGLDVMPLNWDEHFSTASAAIRTTISRLERNSCLPFRKAVLTTSCWRSHLRSLAVIDGSGSTAGWLWRGFRCGWRVVVGLTSLACRLFGLMRRRTCVFRGGLATSNLWVMHAFFEADLWRRL